jgi:hypothetical protein
MRRSGCTLPSWHRLASVLLIEALFVHVNVISSQIRVIPEVRDGSGIGDQKCGGVRQGPNYATGLGGAGNISVPTSSRHYAAILEAVHYLVSVIHAGMGVANFFLAGA